MEFCFYQYEKVAIWRRHEFTIKAENEVQAKKIAAEFKDICVADVNEDDNFEYDGNELLFDLEEEITVEDNGGRSTLEISLSSDCGTVVVSNGLL